MQKFGYSVFEYPKLSMFEIQDLLNSHYEVNKTKEQRDKEDKSSLAKQFAEQLNKQNIEHAKNKPSGN